MTLIERIMNAVQDAIQKALGVSLLDMVIQLAATIILVLVVKHFFWGRITDYLSKRKEIMDKNFQEAKDANEEAAKLKDTTENEYLELRAKSKGYIESAKQKGEVERKEILQKAKSEANNLMEMTQKEIEVEKTKAKAEVQKEVIDLATLMASKIIEKEIDKDKYQDIAIEDVERSKEV